MENRVHIQIPKTEMKEIQDAIAVLNTKVSPLLKTLSPQERRSLPKMGYGTEPFVEKAIDLAKSNPQFLPPYVKVENIEVDFTSVQELTNILRPLEQLLDGLEDTIMLAGSEAYVAALSYYNSVKIGMKMNMPGAETIHDELRTRFDRKAAKPEQEEKKEKQEERV